MEPVPRGPFRPVLLIVLIVLHVIVIGGAWFVPVTWGALACAAVLHCLRSLGVTVGYHRYWTHQSFKCARWVQYGLAVLGSLALEGALVIPEHRRKKSGARGWVPDHMQHHAYTDDQGDPHSPLRYPQPWGLLWAHTGWLLWQTQAPAGWKPSSRLDNDPVVLWQYRWFWLIGIVGGFVIPLLLFGLPGLWLAGFCGLVFHLHVTWSVNSICHWWGKRPRNLDGEPWTADASRNNGLVAAVTSGEGWHGNHHVKPNSADLGRDHWYDPGRWLINWLARHGWAWDVKTFAQSEGDA